MNASKHLPVLLRRYGEALAVWKEPMQRAAVNPDGDEVRAALYAIACAINGGDR